MPAPVILLILRILSACLLLAFLGAIIWFLIKEMRITAEALDSQDKSYGSIFLHAEDLPPERYPLRAVTSVGRSATNNIIINTTYASAQHALITRRGGQWWVEDLQSRNGTRVNSIPLTEPLVISAGDAIEIGDVTLKLDM